MSNNYRVIFQRRFLVSELPEVLSPRDSHWQIFDNYIENTRIRLRKIRVPETKSWTRILEQRFATNEDKPFKTKNTQMFLNEIEYKTLEHFKGRETRKNRYFLMYENKQIAIDIFLGKLWGLNIGLIEFENEQEFAEFELPKFFLKEVTNNKFFLGESLVEKTFADVRSELAKEKGGS